MDTKNSFEGLALVFPDHEGTPKGPIPRSLFQLAESKGIPILYATNGHDEFDRYRYLIWFHNRLPNLSTTAKVGWWMCDLRTAEDVKKLQPVGRADYVFLCNQKYLNDYARVFSARTEYVPQCGDDTPGDDVGKRIIKTPCLFIGAVPRVMRSYPSDYHNNRLHIINTIHKVFPVSVIDGERVSPDQKLLYYDTDVSLAVSHPVQGYTSNRLYNILAAKGFCVTLYFPGIEALFENHKHLVWFKDANECIDQIRYYRARPYQRDKIREAGHAEYLRAHTARHRVSTMYEYLDAR